MGQTLNQARFRNRRLLYLSRFVSVDRLLRQTGCSNMFVGGGVVIVRTPRFVDAVLNVFPDTPSTSTRRDWHVVQACQTAILHGAY